MITMKAFHSYLIFKLDPKYKWVHKFKQYIPFLDAYVNIFAFREYCRWCYQVNRMKNQLIWNDIWIVNYRRNLVVGPFLALQVCSPSPTFYRIKLFKDIWTAAMFLTAKTKILGSPTAQRDPFKCPTKASTLKGNPVFLEIL